MSTSDGLHTCHRGNKILVIQRCLLYTSSGSIPRELGRNADSQALSQIYWIRICILIRSPYAQWEYYPKACPGEKTLVSRAIIGATNIKCTAIIITFITQPPTAPPTKKNNKQKTKTHPRYGFCGQTHLGQAGLHKVTLLSLLQILAASISKKRSFPNIHDCGTPEVRTPINIFCRQCVPRDILWTIFIQKRWSSFLCQWLPGPSFSGRCWLLAHCYEYW